MSKQNEIFNDVKKESNINNIIDLFGNYSINPCPITVKTDEKGRVISINTVPVDCDILK